MKSVRARRLSVFWSVLFGILLAAALFAERPADSTLGPDLYPLQISANRGAAALWQSLQKLRTRASLVMITAHPDDEDGGMLAYESRGLGTRVSLVTLNRGEGGANLMSSDYWDALGLVRTQELLRAGNYYGVDQYFTRVCDYGFSKTLAEAREKWTDERVLGDVVRLIRTIRPLVVTSVFVGAPSDGHGNHQMAGFMAKEVFEAAGDPHRFPEQIEEGLQPWTPLKYYARVPYAQKGANQLPPNVIVPAGAYDPLLGESYAQLSHTGWGQHKSQNGGPFVPRAGEAPSPYHRYASRVQSSDAEQSFFDGIDTTLLGIAGSSKQPFLLHGLQLISASVEEAISSYSVAHPERSASALAKGIANTEMLLSQVSRSNLDEAAKYNILHELRIKRAQFNNALVESLGVSMRATVRPPGEVSPMMAMFMGDPDTFRMAVPGQTFQVQVSAASQTSAKVRRVYLEPARHDEFAIQQQTAAVNELAPNKEALWTFSAQASRSASYTRPYFIRPSIEQPYYDLLDPAAFGRPLAPYPLAAWVELEYRGATLKLGQVVQTVQHVAGQGIVYEPLAVAPAISVQVSPERGIVPLNAKSFSVAVTLRGNEEKPANGALRLQLPSGWKSDPAEANFDMAKAGEEQSLTFQVTPSQLSTKKYDIQAIATYHGQEYKEGYKVTGYPGLLPYFLYRPAQYLAAGADVTIAPGLKIAYVMGSGDDVPATLTELGVNVTYLSANDLANGDLAHFDAILLGVRAYAARSDLVTNNQRLLDYVKNGGVLIVQYNTPEFDHNFGPYPYTMGEEPEEVTDENSQVTLLDPGNALFSWPNRLTETDFHDWIEERGSKFLTSWDPRYEALLETHDPGQAPQRGGLLYAKYGKGIYIYNAYALYRELPEGVPGAFRLMANLLSLAKNPKR